MAEAVSKTGFPFKIDADPRFEPQFDADYVEDLKRGSNTEIGLEVIFEMTSAYFSDRQEAFPYMRHVSGKIQAGSSIPATGQIGFVVRYSGNSAAIRTVPRCNFLSQLGGTTLETLILL